MHCSSMSCTLTPHLSCKAPGLVLVYAAPEALLVICYLDDKRRIQHLLEPLSEHEGHQVAQVQRL